MNTNFLWINYFVLSLASLLLVPAAASAADKPNLLIMGEDHDKDTVPRHSRVFKRVLAAVSNQISDLGYDVYDETAISLDNFAQGRSRRSDAELMDIARSVKKPPIDVAVFFSIYASAKAEEHTTKIRTRLTGRILNVSSGQFLDQFEVTSPREWNAEPKCTRECILETVGDYSRTLANDLGAILAEKLEAIVSPGTGGFKEQELANAYTLIFDNFSPEDVLEIEEYLVIFSGYSTHRPVYQSQRRAEIWYESTIGSAKLNRNMVRMLDELDLRGTVQFSGNTITVQKITLRGKKRERSVNNDW